jgi:aryl-alcohol dehydrogenase-like predicted oxidoreductase
MGGIRIVSLSSSLKFRLLTGSTIWSPLEQGILTGKYNDGLPEGSRFAVNVQGASSEKAKFLQSDEGKAQLQKVRDLTKIAEEMGTNMSNLALAWAISNKNVSTCIVRLFLQQQMRANGQLGATKPEQIHENVKALEILPKFDAQLHERVEKILGNKPTPPAAYGRRDEQGNLI